MAQGTLRALRATRWVAPGLLALGLLLMLRDPAAATPPPCPSGFAEDPARASDLWARLARVPEGAALARAPFPPVCFGGARLSVITEAGALLVDDRLSSSEASA